MFSSPVRFVDRAGTVRFNQNGELLPFVGIATVSRPANVPPKKPADSVISILEFVGLVAINSVDTVPEPRFPERLPATEKFVASENVTVTVSSLVPVLFSIGGYVDSSTVPAADVTTADPVDTEEVPGE